LLIWPRNFYLGAFA